MLVLDRDGVKPDAGLSASIVEAGAELTVGRAPATPQCSPTRISRGLRATCSSGRGHGCARRSPVSRRTIDARCGARPVDEEEEVTVEGVRERPF